MRVESDMFTLWSSLPVSIFCYNIPDYTIVRCTCIRKHTKRCHKTMNEPAKVEKEGIHSPVIGPVVRQEHKKLVLRSKSTTSSC